MARRQRSKRAAMAGYAPKGRTEIAYLSILSPPITHEGTRECR
jgi:hypothetical protein